MQERSQREDYLKKELAKHKYGIVSVKLHYCFSEGTTDAIDLSTWCYIDKYTKISPYHKS